MKHRTYAAAQWLILAMIAVPVLTAMDVTLDVRPANPGPPLSEQNQHRAVAVGSYGVSHGCRSAEPYPPLEAQRSALVEDAPGVIRLTTIDEGRAVLAGQAPGTLIAVCTR